ncbi:MAG: HEAT repeat domain-containing protein [Planctomycetota bacterium]|nr:HEAT repeat domain-containing protein [Planctomycetota bacterium]
MRHGIGAWCLVVLAIAGTAIFAGCNGNRNAGIDASRAYIDARTAIRQAAEDQDPVTRSRAIEALAETVADQAGGLFTQALSDPNPTVRYAAAMALGDVKYAPGKKTLLKMAETDEPDKRVLCAVIYALYRLGDDRYAGELGGLLFDKEKLVRSCAAQAMGRMREPSAIGPLKTLQSDEHDAAVELQIVESLAMLGDARSRELLESYTKRTPYLDDRLIAIQAIPEVAAQSPRAVQTLSDLLSKRHPTTVRLAAAGALARLGVVDEGGYELCIQAVQDPDTVLLEGPEKARRVTPADASSLQALAAISLGWMNQEEAVDVLHPLLASPNGIVRVAAGMSILNLLSDYGFGGEPARRKPAEMAPAKPSATSRPARRPKRRKLHTAGAKD